MTTATLIIHPGYSIDSEKEDYKFYWTNLKRLSQQSIDNLILVLEEQVSKSPIDFKAQNTWRTKYKSGTFIEDYLNNSKFDEFHLAGEWVYWIGEACVGMIAHKIQREGLKAKLISDCVYPLEPPVKKEYFNDIVFRKGSFLGSLTCRKDYKFMKQLYDESIKILDS